MMLVAHYDPLWLLNVAKCIRHGTPPHRHSATKNKKLFKIYIYKRTFLQLDEYETASNFIQLNQNMTSDCLLI